MTITPPTVPVPQPAAQPLRLALPGGMAVAGVPLSVGADGLTQALSLVAAAGPAMAPLAPIFTLIDAVLAVKDFAQAVPELITNPGALIEAIVGLVRKIGKLASLIPQLSVPLMIRDVVDALIALLGGLGVQLQSIAAQEARIAAAVAAASALPQPARGALEVITGRASQSVGVQRADLATALLGAAPLIGIVNTLVSLIGLPGLNLSLDVTSGSTQDAIDALNIGITVLQAFRRAIPA